MWNLEVKDYTLLGGYRKDSMEKYYILRILVDFPYMHHLFQSSEEPHYGTGEKADIG